MSRHPARAAPLLVLVRNVTPHVCRVTLTFTGTIEVLAESKADAFAKVEGLGMPDLLHHNLSLDRVEIHKAESKRTF